MPRFAPFAAPLLLFPLLSVIACPPAAPTEPTSGGRKPGHRVEGEWAYDASITGLPGEGASDCRTVGVRITFTMLNPQGLGESPLRGTVSTGSFECLIDGEASTVALAGTMVRGFVGMACFGFNIVFLDPRLGVVDLYNNWCAGGEFTLGTWYTGWVSASVSSRSYPGTFEMTHVGP